MLNFKGNWDRHLTIVEFICNNSYQATTSMAPYDIYLGIQVIDSNLLEQRKFFTIAVGYLYTWVESIKLKKSRPDPQHDRATEELDPRENLTFKEKKPVKVLDRKRETRTSISETI